ncbi:hypothetical protein M0802_010723 [Mischocyttarus mexicanus]|nr:hypothetical protein M0802_010723 [Mischocyttarus mexicanus]
MSNRQESVTMANTEKCEQMKKELEKIGIYQPDASIEYMKQVFDFVQESKEMANTLINNPGNQKDLPYSTNNLTNKPDVMIKGDSIPETDNNRAKPSCSYNTHCNNSSSESPKPRNKRNTANRKKSTEDNDGSNNNGADNKNLSRQKSKNNSSQESCNLREEKQISKDFIDQSKKWKINPLGSQSNQNDMALQQPKRPIAQERLPFRLCKGTHTEEESDKIMNDLNIHLKNMANLWLSYHGTTELKFQWGTPIQVDTDNNSLDRIPSMINCFYDDEDIDMISNYDDEGNRNNCDDEDNLSSIYDRVNKRKALWFANAKITNNSSSDEEDTTTLSVIKKSRFDNSSKMYKTMYKKELLTQDKSPLKEDLDKEDLFINNEKDDTDSKSINVKSLQEQKTISPEIVSNSKRKSSLLDKNKTQVSSLVLRSQKDLNKNDLEGSPSTSRKEINTNKELKLQSEKTDKDIKESLIIKDVVVKLLPMESFSAKLAKQCERLKQADAERKKKILFDQQEALRKTMEEKDKRKQDFLRRRIQEMDKMSEEKQKVLDREKRKDRLMEVLESKSAARVEKWRIQGRKLKKQKQESENDNIEEDEIDKILEEIENDDHVSKTQITCPICNKLFPNDKIENHAAMCDQFQTEDEYSAQNSKSMVKDKKKNSKGLYKCNICSLFQTDNGIDYEDHINKCLQERQNSPTRGTTILIDVPNSPVKSYQSISEQKNSNIDYTDQLLNITKKTQVELEFPAIVPGGIYTDLTRVHMIPDNLLAMNDLTNRWVGNQTVIYSRNITGTNTLVDGSTVALIFHGLDTFATIFLNDHQIGKTSNMFLKYIFYIEEYLKIGENVLKIIFQSPVKMAEDLYNNQSLRYIVPPKCVPKEYNGECHVNHIRKMQASFSWDWGPAFPSMGIWKSVELISTKEILVTDVTTDVYERYKFWEIIVTTFFKLPSSRNISDVTCNINSRLYINNTNYVQNSSDVMLQVKDGYITASTVLKIDTELIDRWWPNGYGKQNLYKLKITITTGTEILNKYLRIGFRTVELIEEPLKKGLSFYFRINGVPIFAKGSNFIPASVFPELTDEEHVIRHLLQSAKETHMNMLRVWGGGMYESDLFYNLADEIGIMIWQDFMFACSMYPTSEEFLNSVKEEVIQNVIRLKNHASVVLWAGNNENEAALYGNWYGTGTANIYQNDYIKLYVNLIKKEVEQLDSTRPFVVSSPSNVHYYNYLNNGWDINQYPRSRFMSEYGFQSMPSIYTISKIINNFNDLNIDSKIMKHRQHLPFGTEFMKLLISKNFLIPKSNNTIRDFIDFIYLSQINQAVSVKVQTESYRQARSELNVLGEGFTMGALYWQLNDVWQAPSWSSIEYGGRWKMLHYYAKEFFSPIIVTSHLSRGNELSVYIVSDKLYEINNCTLKLSVYNWESMQPLHVYSFYNINIKSNNAMLVTSMWLDKFLEKIKCGTLAKAKKFCVISLTLEDNIGLKIAPVNYVYPTVLKDVNIPSANINIKINGKQLPGKLFNYPDYEIELTTNNIALFVWLEVKSIDGHFSENGFHMFHEKKIVNKNVNTFYYGLNDGGK